MKVRITCGAYGHRPDMNEPRIVRKDNTSPPFDLEDTEARRIIELGIAECCEEETDGPLPDDIRSGYQNTEEENCMATAEAVMSMGYIDMKKLAKKLGVDAKGTKEELQKKLEIALDIIKDTQKEKLNIGNTGNDDNSEETPVMGNGGQDVNRDTDDGETPPLLEAQVPV